MTARVATVTHGTFTLSQETNRIRTLFLVTLFLFAIFKVDAAEIHVAVRSGDIARVKALLNQDPQLIDSQENQYKSTPLHIAAHDGRLEIARILLSRGASLEAKDKDLATPAFMAALKGRCDVLALLLKSGANASAVADEGVRPLHVASMNGYAQCVKMLLDAGADPNVRDRTGASPLSLAQSLKAVDVVALLKSRGAR